MTFYRQVNNLNPLDKGEWRSRSPITDGLKRRTGYLVVVCNGSAGPAALYVALNDTGSWQRVDAGTGTTGS